MGRQDLTKSTEFARIENPETAKKLVVKSRLRLSVICWIQILGGAVSIMVGVVAVALNSSNPSVPFIIAAPLWTGFLICITGVFGFMIDKRTAHGSSAKSLSTLCLAYFSLCVVSSTICGISSIIQIIGVTFCVPDSSFYNHCLPQRAGNMATAIFGMLIGLVLCAVSVLGNTFFCVGAGRLLWTNKRRDIVMEQKYFVSSVS